MKSASILGSDALFCTCKQTGREFRAQRTSASAKLIACSRDLQLIGKGVNAAAARSEVPAAC
jgi:hypothetical protein